MKDDFSWWNGSTTITAPSSGWYIITLNVEWANAGTSNVFKYSAITLNSTAASGIVRSTNSDERQPNQSTSTVEYLTTGDIIRGVVRHTVGSNYDVTKARISVIKIG